MGPELVIEWSRNTHYRNYTEDMLWQWACRAKLEFNPGEKFSYSNAGIALLGLVLSKIAKKPYQQLIQEIIIHPLGMDSTYFSAIPPAALPRFAKPHYGEDVVPAWEQQAFAPAGALRSTLRDMQKYAHAYLHPPETALGNAFRCAQNKLWGHCCYGIGINDDGLLNHGGSTAGSNSWFWVNPKTAQVFIMLSNTSTDAYLEPVLQHCVNPAETAPPMLPTEYLLPELIVKHLHSLSLSGLYQDDSGRRYTLWPSQSATALAATPKLAPT